MSSGADLLTGCGGRLQHSSGGSSRPTWRVVQSGSLLSLYISTEDRPTLLLPPTSERGARGTCADSGQIRGLHCFSVATWTAKPPFVSPKHTQYHFSAPVSASRAPFVMTDHEPPKIHRHVFSLCSVEPSPASSYPRRSPPIIEFWLCFSCGRGIFSILAVVDRQSVGIDSRSVEASAM